MLKPPCGASSGTVAFAVPEALLFAAVVPAAVPLALALAVALPVSLPVGLAVGLAVVAAAVAAAVGAAVLAAAAAGARSMRSAACQKECGSAEWMDQPPVSSTRCPSTSRRFRSVGGHGQAAESVRKQRSVEMSMEKCMVAS